MTDARVGEQLAGRGVVDDLMDVDGDTPVFPVAKPLGLDAAGDGGELPGPVVAYRRAPDDAPALPRVGPVYVRVHQLEGGGDVAGVERAVGRAQQGLALRHTLHHGKLASWARSDGAARTIARRS